MKLRYLIPLLFLGTLFAQNSRYDSVALGPKGPIPFATVAICTQPANSSTQPCSPLANLCSSLSDTTCTSPNPFTADSLGNYHAYIKQSQSPFTLQIYGPQVASPLVQPDQIVPLGGGSNGATLNLLSLNGYKFADQFPGASVGAQIDAAGASCSGNTCTVVIPAYMGAGDPSSALANVLYLDYRPKGTIDGPNEVAFNVWDGTALNDQQASVGAYDRAILTAGRIFPNTGGKSFGTARFYMYAPASTLAAGTGGDSTTAALVFTQTNTDSNTNQGLMNAFEGETFFNGTGLNIYDMRAFTTNAGPGVISPVGTVGVIKMLDSQGWATVPSTLHIQKWIGTHTEAPQIPTASMTATGTVTCTGTNLVTWATGDHFTDRGMFGYPIVINAVTYVVTSPMTSTTLTVLSATGGATTCPNGGPYNYTFTGNQYSFEADGHVWLRADQSPAGGDTNGPGGIILDTVGSGGSQLNHIILRDVSSRNADGTFNRKGLYQNGLFTTFRNQNDNTDLWTLDDSGNMAVTGHVNKAAANNDSAGVVSGATTTAVKTFATNYTSTPACVVTPTTSGVTSFIITAQSNSGFTVTYAPSAATNFNYVCFGNPN